MTAEIVQRLGMTGIVREEMRIEGQLAEHGLTIEDVGWILQTHHHIDHAAKTTSSPTRP